MSSLGQDRCWAEIDCAALRHNARVARERVGPSTSLLAVVKANGYGHGMVEIADALRNEVDLFGVANLGEALELRPAVTNKPIMILGPALPEEQEAICRAGFIPSISSLAEARAFAANPAGINFAVDTGMGRMGCWQDDAIAELERIARVPGLLFTASRPTFRLRKPTWPSRKTNSHNSMYSSGKCAVAFPGTTKFTCCSAPEFSVSHITTLIWCAPD